MIIQVNMVTVNNNSPILDHIHLDAHAQLTYDNVMSFSQWYKLLKTQLISSSTALLTVISNKIVSGLEVLLSIQKGTVVCNGGGGVFLWHVLFQILRCAIFGNLAEFLHYRCHHYNN